MSKIIFDNYDGIDANPNLIFKDLNFELKTFDFVNDIIFKNMTKIKKEDRDKEKIDIFEDISLVQSYEFNFENIIEKLKEFFPDNNIKICNSMFIQLYLHLLLKKNDKFIFKRASFESENSPKSLSNNLQYMDNKKNLLFIMHYENYKINNILDTLSCSHSYLYLLKTGNDENKTDLYSGILDGIIYTKNIIDWAKFLRQKLKNWIDENKIKSSFEYEKHCELEKKKEKDIILYKENYTLDQLYEGTRLYSRTKNFNIIYNYFDIGYFDVLEFSNSEINIAINAVSEKIIDLNK